MRNVLVGAAIGASAAALLLFLHNYGPAPVKHAKVLLIGDSHGEGFKAAKFNNLGAIHGVDTVVEVKGGTWAPYWEPKIGGLLSQHKPTLVLISLGGNDMHIGGEDRKVKVAAAVKSIVDQVRAAGAVPVWIESPTLPWPDLIDVQSMWLGSGAVHFPGPSAIDHLNLKRPDNVHFTVDGYRVFGEVLWKWLQEQNLVPAT